MRPEHTFELPHHVRMARADGCPNCVVNYSLPTVVHNDPPRGFLANYICEDCGHAWSTSWSDN